MFSCWQEMANRLWERPFVEGASVAGEIVEQTRGPKVIAFKKRRRQNSKRKRGHRQDLTLVRITGLHAGGGTPSEATAEPRITCLPRFRAWRKFV